MTASSITTPALSGLRGLAIHAAAWTSRHSVTLLRISVGVVFFAFAVPKFIPGASPVEGLVMRTVETLSFGIVPGAIGIVLVAALETFIALTLITGRLLPLGLLAMAGAMVGFFSPLVLFPSELFDGGLTLAAQYILKDVVLVAAALVIAGRALAARLVLAGPAA
jgi:putative oxidoreductase